MITVNKTAKTLEEGITNMTDSMVEDYGKHFGRSDNAEVKSKMWKEYADGFSSTAGKKFIKVVGGSVKRLGKYEAAVRLHREVVADITFEVVAEK